MDKDFLRSEAGAVTVDWVVLTAGLVGLGLATMSVVSTGVQDTSGDIQDQLEADDIISSSFASVELSAWATLAGDNSSYTGRLAWLNGSAQEYFGYNMDDPAVATDLIQSQYNDSLERFYASIDNGNQGQAHRDLGYMLANEEYAEANGLVLDNMTANNVDGLTTIEMAALYETTYPDG